MSQNLSAAAVVIDALWVNHYWMELHGLTLLRLVDFSIKFDTFKPGWSIVFIEWFSFPPPPLPPKKRIFSLIIDSVLANGADIDEIWVFTVCESTCLGVSDLHRVKKAINMLLKSSFIITANLL